MLDEPKHKGAISDRNLVALAYLELSHDKAFNRLSVEDRYHYVTQAIKAGQILAEQIFEEYKIRDPRKIAEQMGVKVLGEGRQRENIPRSAYFPKDKTIIISRHSMERWLPDINSNELANHLLRFFVAHELFHHLEHARIGNVSEKLKIKSFHLGPIIRYQKMDKLSDVAAHAFTQALLALEFSPVVFDYLAYLLYTDINK